MALRGLLLFVISCGGLYATFRTLFYAQLS